MRDWLQTPPGACLLDWEQAQFDQAVADIFGYHALQLGLAEIQGLRANRMPHRWFALDGAADAAQTPPAGAVLRCEAAALPFAANSLDLLVLPHTVEMSADPHAALREIERVLVPEGRVVLSGFNPSSLWGWRQRRARWYRHLGFGEPYLYLPESSEFIGYRRMRDWLRLLSFEVESGRFGLYRPAVRSQKWLERHRWLDRAGERWWPIFGAVYFIVAVKRVRGMTLLPAGWKQPHATASAPVPVAGRVHRAPLLQGAGPGTACSTRNRAHGGVDSTPQNTKNTKNT